MTNILDKAIVKIKNFDLYFWLLLHSYMKQAYSIKKIKSIWENIPNDKENKN